MAKEPIDELIAAHAWLSPAGCHDSVMKLSRAERNVLLGTIAIEVRHRRELLGLTQPALAKKAGVPANVVGRLERGIYNPSTIVLDALASALETSIVDLLRVVAPR